MWRWLSEDNPSFPFSSTRKSLWSIQGCHFLLCHSQWGVSTEAKDSDHSAEHWEAPHINPHYKGPYWKTPLYSLANCFTSAKIHLLSLVTLQKSLTHNIKSHQVLHSYCCPLMEKLYYVLFYHFNKKKGINEFTYRNVYILFVIQILMVSLNAQLQKFIWWWNCIETFCHLKQTPSYCVVGMRYYWGWGWGL